MRNDILKQLCENSRYLDKLYYDFENNIRNELYSACQFKLAARSNQTEGNTLTEEDTATLFDTQMIPSTRYKPREIEEAQGHFLMFNEMLKTIDSQLNIDIIKSFHKQLTQGIYEFKANGGEPGSFKTRANIAGTSKTTDPKSVENELNSLLDIYYNNNDITFDSIEQKLAWFHAKYEHIHPFQDYNGRTGRMILFRESLLANKPIIINNTDKAEYINALKYAHDNDDAIESCKKLTELFIKWKNETMEELKIFIE